MKVARFYRSLLEAALIAAVVTLSGCSGDEYDQREDRIRKALADNESIGSDFGSKPVWLVKHSLAGNLRNAVCFGYVDNLLACREFADAFNSREGEDLYSCAQMDD